jgi:hypothetical protein
MQGSGLTQAIQPIGPRGLCSTLRRWLRRRCSRLRPLPGGSAFFGERGIAGEDAGDFPLVLDALGFPALERCWGTGPKFRWWATVRERSTARLQLLAVSLAIAASSPSVRASGPKRGAVPYSIPLDSIQRAVDSRIPKKVPIVQQAAPNRSKSLAPRALTTVHSADNLHSLNPSASSRQRALR